METNTLQSLLSDVIDFLRSADSLLNSHMVSFISENVWENRIPGEIAEEINRMTYDDTLNVLYAIGGLKDEASLIDYVLSPPVDCRALVQFLVQCRKYSLEVLSSTRETRRYFKCKTKEGDEGSLVLKCVKPNISPQYLTPAKKRHEVSLMSVFIAGFFQKYLDKYEISGAVVDIGGGKGYLGSSLALHHGIKVLGVDVASNVSSAAKTRNEKICRKLSEKCTLYQQKTAYVSPKTDLGGLVKELEGDWGKVDCVALVGLHTCGNLGPSCVELFASKASSGIPISMLCNVGCCYNLLEEKFDPEGYSNRAKPCLPPSLNGKLVEVPLDSNPGFPMSTFLCNKNFWLGRNARNLASQSLDRVMFEKKISVDALFQRALLQNVLMELANDASEPERGVLLLKLEKMLIDGKGIGRLAKGNCVLGVYEYFTRAFGKLGLKFTLSESDVDEMCLKFKHFKSKITMFYIMRMFLAPVVETVILLDRLLYILEEGINEAYLVKLFDPVVSPRCFALCARINID
ncbi:probable methyltransferase-like protein 25 [Hetaerina americana]|uniref:probable methyltransferase-like protein 25 n=1 Tax=Hetaerina americana TaxID=62018 RepID=UPI003A7F5096